MAYNRHFYNNFHGSNFTFHNRYPSPLPAPPPPPVTPMSLTPHISDQEFIKKFELLLKTPKPQIKHKEVNIRQLKEKMITLMSNLNEIQKKQKELSENIDNYTEDEWKSMMDTISSKKSIINDILTQFNGPYMDFARKYLAKRMAKRSRLKRLQEETKRQKIERIKENEERSRKIDENLQKIKDCILKAKQEEEAKLEADMVLKDVIRKKSDAKKCLSKLDALVKLRQARQNTAKGRGQNIMENEAVLFQNNIEKLRTLWTLKLEMYDKEENSLRARLVTATSNKPAEDVIQVESNLKKWRQVLFGGGDPQVDFNGDIDKFISVRTQWDRYINNEGTPLPIGWVINI